MTVDIVSNPKVFEMKLIDVWRAGRVFVILVVASILLFSVAATLSERTSSTTEWWLFLIMTGGFGTATMLLFRFRWLVAKAHARRTMVVISWTLGLALPFVIFLADNSEISVRISLLRLAEFLAALCVAHVLWLSGLSVWITAYSRSSEDSVGPKNLIVGADAAHRFSSHFTADADPKLLRIAACLYDESEGMRRLSIHTRVIVGVLITLAAMVVLFAGFITSIDIRGVSPVQKAQDYLASARHAEQQALEQLRIAEAMQSIKQNSENTKNDPSDGTSLRELISRLQTREFGDLHLLNPRKTIPDLEADLENARNYREKVENLVINAQSAEVLGSQAVGNADGAITQQKATTSGSTTEALIAAGITRFGIVILMMFLAQALINLDRYALRLSAFYRSRALMLIWTGGDLAQMQEAAKSLSTDHLNVGRESKSPIDDVAKLAEAAKALK